MIFSITSVIFGAFFKFTKFHRTSRTQVVPLLFAGFGGQYLWNRYLTSIKIFDTFQPPLQVPELEVERKEILRDCFTVDYRTFSQGIKDDYKYSQVEDLYKYKDLN